MRHQFDFSATDQQWERKMIYKITKVAASRLFEGCAEHNTSKIQTLVSNEYKCTFLSRTFNHN